MPAPTTPSFSPRRKWSISVSVLLSVVAALGLVLMLNYLATRHYWRLPLSWDARTELSPLTRRVLGSITNDVKVIAYFSQRDPLFESVWNLLKEYKFANPRLRLEAVDYENDPSNANLVKSKYRLALPKDANKNLLIFDCEGRPPRIVYGSELSEFDVRPLMSGQTQEVRRTHFKGEMLFTSALIGVLNPRPLKAYFLLGHGELRPDSDSEQAGFSKFAGVLRENSIAVDMLLNLFGERDIPADCNLLIIAGPRDVLLPEELKKIDRYLQQGGRLLVLFSYLSVEKQLGLEAWLRNWGVNVGHDLVVDSGNSDKFGRMVVNHITPHPVMKPLYPSSELFLSQPRSIRVAARSASPETLQVEVLAETGREGRVFTEIRDGNAYARGDEVVEAVPLMVAVEKGTLRGVSPERGATRLIVAGEVMFLSNEGIDNRGNREFAFHAVNWLLGRSELLAPLGPRPIREYKLIITEGQMSALSWILLLGMPGGVLVVGGLVWLRRQKW